MTGIWETVKSSQKSCFNIIVAKKIRLSSGRSGYSNVSFYAAKEVTKLTDNSVSLIGSWASLSV